VVEVGNGRGHCWLKSLHLRETYVKNITILRDFYQFVVFPPLFFFLATEPASSDAGLTGTTNSTKKQWKGHNELKTRFSNGPTKTEPFFPLSSVKPRGITGSPAALSHASPTELLVY
jgi:hypothetical protein